VNACGLHGASVSRASRLTQRIADAPPRMGHPLRLRAESELYPGPEMPDGFFARKNPSSQK
jgi:hypothetical protein